MSVVDTSINASVDTSADMQVDMRIEPIQFQVDERRYDLQFRAFPILQLPLEPGAWKSRFAQDLCWYFESTGKRYLLLCPETQYQLSLLPDVETVGFDYVLFYSADRLLTPALDRKLWQYLQHGGRAVWIVLGQRWFQSAMENHCRGSLLCQKQGDVVQISVDYTHTKPDLPKGLDGKVCMCV